jgi:hypothetical protein
MKNKEPNKKRKGSRLSATQIYSKTNFLDFSTLDSVRTEKQSFQ